MATGDVDGLRWWADERLFVPDGQGHVRATSCMIRGAISWRRRGIIPSHGRHSLRRVSTVWLHCLGEHMSKTRTSLYLLALLLAAPPALAAKALSVNFTIGNTEGFNGVDPASLILSKGRLSGTVTVISPDGTFPCTVNSGSTDIHNKLNLTCTIGPAEMVTLSGTLKSRTGVGKGSFTESFFKETGTYTAARAN